ncbi:hypothetical protein, partial [Pseudomonas syringae group genomosp. 7]|uniref:hypothetical protein n=1 Tax=Pseudomonas syringae group genomosp. 7 TaxID=251699 RepID=UPI00376F640F
EWSPVEAWGAGRSRVDVGAGDVGPSLCHAKRGAAARMRSSFPLVRQVAFFLLVCRVALQPRMAWIYRVGAPTCLW